MDKTELYIKMSECPEIQGQRKKFEDGDILASYRKEWKQVDKDTQKGHRIFDGMVMYCEGLTHVRERDLVVWLPRQDQIQEMFAKDYDQPSTQLSYCNLFAQNEEMYEGIYRKKGMGLAGLFKSMEQLWLAFYMHEKHGKIWNGTKWEKN